MDTRFARQGFLGPDSERIHRKARTAVVGLCGGGSHVVQQQAHVGVGDILIIDPDNSEESNLHRLVGATLDDVVNERPKTFISERLIRGINPDAKVTPIAQDWREVAELLRDRDVIFGCVDTFAARRDLEAIARRYLIPYIDIGMDVHQEGERFRMTGQVILSMPGRPCMRCMGFLTDELLAREAAGYGAAGGKPQVIWPNGALASSAIGVFVQLMTPWHDGHEESVYLEYDGNMGTMTRSNRLLYANDIVCPHFRNATDLGDPFWRPIQPKKQGIQP